MPPLAGAVAPPTAMDANAQDQGPAPAADPNAVFGEVRSAAEPYMKFLASRPSLQPIAKKFTELVKETVQAVSRDQSQQTPSSSNLPG
jgi:hypothetical protein